jgi:hypothetical protein
MRKTSTRSGGSCGIVMLTSERMLAHACSNSAPSGSPPTARCGGGRLRVVAERVIVAQDTQMAIPELERERAERALRRFCEKVPVEVRHELAHDFRVVRSDIEGLEDRRDFVALLREVEKDPTGIFWG